MAKFTVNLHENQHSAHGWAVCVDLEGKKCDITLLIIVDEFLQKKMREKLTLISTNIGTEKYCGEKYEKILCEIFSDNEKLLEKVKYLFSQQQCHRQ